MNYVTSLQYVGLTNSLPVHSVENEQLACVWSEALLGKAAINLYILHLCAHVFYFCKYLEEELLNHVIGGFLEETAQYPP